MTDGPYAETKEQIGGILLLEARDLDHAIELMSKHPGIKIGPFEIRPAADMTEMLRSRQPRWRKAPGYFKKDRDHLTLERVVLPLAKDGRTVDIFLGMILAHTKGGEEVA